MLDLAGSPDPSRLVINRWVSDQTHARIPNLLAPGSITGATVLVLTNAVYFIAGWSAPFDRARTANAGSHRLDGTVVQAPTMSEAADMGYAEGPGWQAVDMPYQGGQSSMLVIVPAAGTFADFERSLDADRFEAIVSALTPHRVTLALPRFTFRRNASLDTALRVLGMTAEFLPGVADLSGIDGSRRLFIQDVIHEGYIAVDEDGTEAAGATAVIIGVTGLPPQATLSVDRPFLVAIRSANGAVLFLGRAVDPAG